MLSFQKFDTRPRLSPGLENRCQGVSDFLCSFAGPEQILLKMLLQAREGKAIIRLSVGRSGQPMLQLLDQCRIAQETDKLLKLLLRHLSRLRALATLSGLYAHQAEKASVPAQADWPRSTTGRQQCKGGFSCGGFLDDIALGGLQFAARRAVKILRLDVGRQQPLDSDRPAPRDNLGGKSRVRVGLYPVQCPSLDLGCRWQDIQPVENSDTAGAAAAPSPAQARMGDIVHSADLKQRQPRGGVQSGAVGVGDAQARSASSDAIISGQ